MKKGQKYEHLQRAEKKTCPICKKVFRAVKDTKNRKQIYCSLVCYRKKRANPIKELKCPVCQKKFFARETRKKFCSHKCYSKELAEKLKNENSWFWKGGKTKEITKKRTSAKYKEWRLKVFSRDGFICQKCGSKKNIEAHHIKEVCNYPDLIYDINNGLTLCHKCHKKTDNYGTKATLKQKELEENE